MLNRTFVIAEIACSHDGNINTLKKIINNAFEAGADAIQLQIWQLKYMMSPENKNFKKLKKIEFNKSQWMDIVKFTRKNYPKLKIFVCLYEHKSIDFIKSLNIDGLKINSSDLTNPSVIKNISKLNVPINLSVGASSINEISYALKILKSHKKLTLMYGLQSFPTKTEEVKLSKIKLLSKKFNLPIGYQDHCVSGSNEANWLISNSIGMGCSIIEIHMHLKNNKYGFDHESAHNKSQFKRLVKMIRTIDNSFGNISDKSFSKVELKYRNFQKKSIVASKNLKKYHKLTEKDFLYLRKDKLGLQPFENSKILNRKLLYDVKKYDLILKKLCN